MSPSQNPGAPQQVAPLLALATTLLQAARPADAIRGIPAGRRQQPALRRCIFPPGNRLGPTASFFHPRYNDFDPRLGLAWSHGGTVLRAGGGIYLTDGQEDDQNLPISDTIQRYTFSNAAFPGLSYPLTPFLIYAENGGLGVVSPRDLDRNRKDDYVAAWTASVQQKLPLNILGTATYLGNKGTDVLATTYTNLVNPATGLAPYPAFGPVPWRGDVGNSTFEALQLNVRRAFQSGFLLSSNFMWSHSINDGSIGAGESDTPQNSFCRSCDKASRDNSCSIFLPSTSCPS